MLPLLCVESFWVCGRRSWVQELKLGLVFSFPKISCCLPFDCIHRLGLGELTGGLFIVLSLLSCLGEKTKFIILSMLKALLLEAVFHSSVSVMTKGRKLAKVGSIMTKDEDLQKLVLGNLNGAIKRGFNKFWYYCDISSHTKIFKIYTSKWKDARWCSTWDPEIFQDIYFHIASNVLRFIPFVLQRKIEKLSRIKCNLLLLEY